MWWYGACFITVMNLVEGRVYCRVKHASPWIPSGKSCPIQCSNIIAAIERLSSIDYHYTLRETKAQQHDEAKRLRLSGKLKKKKKRWGKHSSFKLNREIDALRQRVDPLNDGYNEKHIEFFRKLIENSETLVPLIDELRSLAEGNRTRRAMARFSNTLTDNKFNRTRRMEDHKEVIRKMTNTLNKYTHVDYRFTVGMTAQLLKKMAGQDAELRAAIRSVLEVLKFARASDRSDEMDSSRPVLHLSSQHCLTGNVPGCYCLTGFVEDEGLCVKPTTCITDQAQTKYLSRIILH